MPWPYQLNYIPEGAYHEVCDLTSKLFDDEGDPVTFDTYWIRVQIDYIEKHHSKNKKFTTKEKLDQFMFIHKLSNKNYVYFKMAYNPNFDEYEEYFDKVTQV